MLRSASSARAFHFNMVIGLVAASKRWGEKTPRWGLQLAFTRDCSRMQAYASRIELPSWELHPSPDDVWLQGVYSD